MCNHGFDGLGCRSVWLVPLGQHQRLFSPHLHRGFAVSAGESPAASPDCRVSLCDGRRVIFICHPLRWKTKLMLGEGPCVSLKGMFTQQQHIIGRYTEQYWENSCHNREEQWLVLVVSAFFDYLLMVFHVSFVRRWPRMVVTSWW